MDEENKTLDERSTPQYSRYQRVRNAVILPDGTKPVPLGSGVITGVLGTGGMSNVYQIWNPQLEVSRAVKLLHPNYTEDAKQRFQTEIKITAKLHHPNIVEIHGVGEWNGLPYIEMELIDGFTLERLIAERGAFPVELCSAIGVMIARALWAAHNENYVLYGKEYHGIIHRDLKPSNIMVSKSGAVKLMDFGIARPTDASIHTTDGSILGTMQYLSPEQLDGKELDVRTDIYSLGAIIYEIITGVNPFPEKNLSRLMLNKIKNSFNSLDAFALKIPARFKRLIHQCLNFDREKRVRSSALLLQELEKIHRIITHVPPEIVIKKFMNVPGAEKTIVAERHRVPLIPVASAVAVIMAGVCFTIGIQSWIQHRSKPPAPQATSKAPEPAATPPVALPSPRPSPPVAKASEKKVPEPVPPAAHAKPRSLLDQLVEEHGTGDPFEIFLKEFQEGNYRIALEIYPQIPQEQKTSPKAIIYRMRILDELGKSAELAGLLETESVNDGECYLRRARFMYQAGDIDQCLKYLELSTKTPAEFFDSQTLHQEVLLYSAMCETKRFDGNPTDIQYKKALDSWYQVKALFKTNREHALYKKAAAEMQRIERVYRELNG